MKSNKKRLDLIVFEKGLVSSRMRAKAVIMAGRILVNNIVVDKPGLSIKTDAEIILKGDDIAFVSRGGLKLEKALKEMPVNVLNTICLDVGASTGGFTDCLLQYGASLVYAVDVGYGQIAWKLRTDKKVVVIERTNIRYMTKETIPDSIDIAVIDVSFISLKIVVPAVLKFLKPNSTILALIKPQFEVGKKMVGKKGVVKDPLLHESVIKDISYFFTNIGLVCKKVVPSPVLGPKGNKEFIIILQKKM